ncbi:MAG: hypothetical protein C3F02_03815 [Parcubacteria group bacterium]|nr:MAG: hypothetical protein C3F02_03815 [Parcubacteria group bacterium]
MFDDLKQNNQNNFASPQPAPAAPAPQPAANPSGPMEDMFADVDPAADRSLSAVQSGKIRPVSQRPAADFNPGSANQMPSRPVGPADILRDDMAITDHGSKIKKVIIVVIGVFLALGLAASAYVFIFNKPRPAANIDVNALTNNANALTNSSDDNSNTLTNQAPDNLVDPALLDDDGDGLTNDHERQLGTNPLLADTDNDRLFDKDEVEIYRTNPLLNDSDNDGLSDYDEAMIWFTNPLIADTDGDGFSDGTEVQNNYNPLGSGTIDQWAPPAPQPLAPTSTSTIN